MSKFKKRLKRAAKVGLGLAAAYALTRGKADAGKKLISGKDSEVGAIAGQTKPKVTKILPKAKTKADISKTFKDRKPFKGGLSMNEVRARNKAFNEKLKKIGPVKRYSILDSMGFSGGKMIKAKGGKEIVGKKTKLF